MAHARVPHAREPVKRARHQQRAVEGERQRRHGVAVRGRLTQKAATANVPKADCLVKGPGHLVWEGMVRVLRRAMRGCLPHCSSGRQWGQRRVLRPRGWVPPRCGQSCRSWATQVGVARTPRACRAPCRPAISNTYQHAARWVKLAAVGIVCVPRHRAQAGAGLCVPQADQRVIRHARKVAPVWAPRNVVDARGVLQRAASGCALAVAAATAAAAALSAAAGALAGPARAADAPQPHSLVRGRRCQQAAVDGAKLDRGHGLAVARQRERKAQRSRHCGGRCVAGVAARRCRWIICWRPIGHGCCCRNASEVLECSGSEVSTQLCDLEGRSVVCQTSHTKFTSKLCPSHSTGLK
jgi:hypothetical protein